VSEAQLAIALLVAAVLLFVYTEINDKR